MVWKVSSSLIGEVSTFCCIAWIGASVRLLRIFFIAGQVAVQNAYRNRISCQDTCNNMVSAGKIASRSKIHHEIHGVYGNIMRKSII